MPHTDDLELYETILERADELLTASTSEPPDLATVNYLAGQIRSLIGKRIEYLIRCGV